MEFKKIKNKGQAHIFNNPILESLSKTFPWVTYAIYIPVIILMIIYTWKTRMTSSFNIAALFFAGLLFWTLFEYLAHRYLFHYKPTTAYGKRLVYIFHGNHHEFPKDTQRLFMPPLPSIVISGTVLALFYFISFIISGKGIYAIIFFPGFIAGYLLYASLHYALHVFNPPKYMKALWRNHSLHHYKDPEVSYGVSSPLWDIIFGTYPHHKKVRKA